MMKGKVLARVSLWCYLSGMFLLAPAPVTHAQQPKISVNFCVPNADVYPFFRYEGEQLNGTNPDFVRATFQQPALQHIEVNFVQRPWKRCGVELKSGAIDMIIGSYRPERDNIGLYPNELGFDLDKTIVSTADICFISTKGPQLEKTLDGIAGKSAFSVGVEAGFSQDHKPDIQPKWMVIYNHLEKYRLLQKGRVDAIVQVCSMDGFPIATKAEAYGYQDFETLYPPYQSNPGYIVFSQQFANDNAALAHTILTAMQQVDREEIYSRYRSISPVNPLKLNESAANQ